MDLLDSAVVSSSIVVIFYVGLILSLHSATFKVLSIDVFAFL
jgi:hypothetical protein